MRDPQVGDGVGGAEPPGSKERLLSDVPLGDGWWIASDGKWYPPAAQADSVVGQAHPAADADTPPVEGWWKASDGNWYAPELHPDNIASVGPAAISPRSAVTSQWATPASGSRSAHRYPTTQLSGSGMDAQGVTTPVNGYDAASHEELGQIILGSAHTSYGPAEAVGAAQPAGQAFDPEADAGTGGPADRRTGYDRRSGLERRSGVADRRTGDRLGVGDRRRQGPDDFEPSSEAGSSAGGPVGNDLDFDPMLDAATLFGDLGPTPAGPQPAAGRISPAPPASPTATSPPATSRPAPATQPPTAPPSVAPQPKSPPADYPPAGGALAARASGTAAPGAPARPPLPGFSKPNVAPSGSTVHTDLPASPYKAPPTSSMPRPDGFDDWLRSFDGQPVARGTRVSQAPPLRVAQTPSFTGGPTIGGPASAAPRKPTSEADAFMLKPSRRSSKGVAQGKRGQKSQKAPRTKLSAAMMITILVLVLAGVTAAIFYLHGVHGPGHF